MAHDDSWQIRAMREIRSRSFDNESADLSGNPTSLTMVKHPL